MHDLKINSKGLKIAPPQNFEHANTDHVKDMGFIWIKIFNDFSNIILGKGDSWKKLFCSFKEIS